MDGKKAKNERKTAKMSHYPIPAKMTADIVGTKPDTVLKQRHGLRTGGKVAKKIALTDELLIAGQNKLIEEVKRVVNF